MRRPYSEACERNKAPILRVLSEAFGDRSKVLEIGSGTGQHAVHFARHLTHLQWQPTDIPDQLPGMRLWLTDARLANLLGPIPLDIDQPDWPRIAADAAFTANTLHIVSWPQVVRLFEQLGTLLPAGGVLAVYGPFNYNRRHTSESNARFDLMLRSREPSSGIRDFEDVDVLAQRNGLRLSGDYEMPANNRTVVWVKE